VKRHLGPEMINWAAVAKVGAVVKDENGVELTPPDRQGPEPRVQLEDSSSRTPNSVEPALGGEQLTLID